MLYFSVADTGIGIDPTDQDNLFQPFTQADTSTTREFGGTGLGLTICRRIVQLMQGEIGYESTLGEGSTFWFKVPLNLASAADTAATSLETDRSPEITASSTETVLKILVVEDYEDNRILFMMLLENLGYQADAVTNGVEFLEQMAGQDYDMVLMDCQMPMMDGYEATRQLRQREGDQKHTIIIGLTAHAMEGDRQKCLDAGMDDYMSKPVRLEALAEMIEKWTQD